MEQRRPSGHCVFCGQNHSQISVGVFRFVGWDNKRPMPVKIRMGLSNLRAQAAAENSASFKLTVKENLAF